MISKKLTIGALFDDGARSYYNALKDIKFLNVISVGIRNNKDNYLKCDLSIQNLDLIKELKILPKPDIILASPPCESGSIADNQRRNIKQLLPCGENEMCYILRNEEFYDINNKTAKSFLIRNFYKQCITRLNGESTALAVMKIIREFQPKYFVIENPKTSLIGKYFNYMLNVKDGHFNLAHYNSYDGNFTRKPTIFLSNIKMNLKHDNVKNKCKWSETKGYDFRSQIPQQLILEIIENILTDWRDKNND